MTNNSQYNLTEKFFTKQALHGFDIISAFCVSNDYLANLPSAFNTDNVTFYKTLNQRNLSGFVGEVFKHSISAYTDRYTPNPHPDGRPDLLDLSMKESRSFFSDHCFSEDGAPQRSRLAPYPFGGIEVKSCIGSLKNASKFPIGKPRHEAVTSINYWAHHAHECELLGLYYDFCMQTDGSPQIKAAFFVSLEADDWNKVSIGDPQKKKN